jgi:mRNA interferase RelE/StbE
MPYELAFHPEALREWRTWTAGIREQFKKKLAEPLIEPRMPASKLRSSSHRHKIKLRAAGFRLVYEVRNRDVLVLVGPWASGSAMLSIARPISAEAHAPWPTPSPLSWIGCAGRPSDGWSR